ncbi:MAG: hypothetical protein EA384_09290 [Spirochaetaceae bacterium]|nr:MAG: hypothetical protein EA384_09290 [Spirochaetaceae bacterium]
MTTAINTSFRQFVLPVAILLALTACERGPVGIFASIEQEVEIQEGNLLKDVAVNGMVEADGYYFAAVGGRIRYRPVSGDESDWSSISNPSGYRTNHSRPTSIVHIDPGGAGDAIYVSFVEGERKRSGVYQLDPVGRSYNAAGSLGSGVHVTRLFALGAELFGSIQFKDEDDDPEFELWYLGAGGGASLDTAASISTDVGRQARPFISAAANGTDDFWFITSSSVFHTAAAAGQLANIGKPADIGTSLGGIFFNANDLYLSSRDGRTVRGGSTGYVSRDAGGANPTDPSEWTTIITANDRAFTEFASADGAHFATLDDVFDDGVLFVGTYRTLSGRTVVSPGGYMEIPGPLFGSVRRPAGNNYQSAEISKAAVMQIFIPGQANTIFALTGGRGLWRGEYDSDGETTWYWE